MNKTPQQRYDENQYKSGKKQYKRWLDESLFKKVDAYIRRISKDNGK